MRRRTSKDDVADGLRRKWHREPTASEVDAALFGTYRVRTEKATRARQRRQTPEWVRDAAEWLMERHGQAQ